VNSLTTGDVGQSTDANLTETALTAANVNAAEFGKLYSYRVDGPVDGQPLYVAGETINGAYRDVLYVATTNGKQYAFDADNSLTIPLRISRLVPGTPVNARVGTRMSAPVQWESPTDGPLGYVWSENDVLKAYRLKTGRMMTPAHMHGGVFAGGVALVRRFVRRHVPKPGSRDDLASER
jgi:hypothetical protein